MPDQKCRFWTKFGRFWAKNPNFYGSKQKFWYQHNRKPPRQLVRIVFWSGIRSNGPKMPIFGPKCQFWAKFVNGANDHYTRGYNFPIGTTPQKNFRFQARGHFLGLIPVFGHFWPSPR